MTEVEKANLRLAEGVTVYDCYAVADYWQLEFDTGFVLTLKDYIHPVPQSLIGRYLTDGWDSALILDVRDAGITTILNVSEAIGVPDCIVREMTK